MFYRSELDKNLIEHEFDYVFTGIFDGTPCINEDEVEDWKFTDIHSLSEGLKNNPASYTSWFKLIMNRIEESTQTFGENDFYKQALIQGRIFNLIFPGQIEEGRNAGVGTAQSSKCLGEIVRLYKVKCR